jgi:hypothetical protein
MASFRRLSALLAHQLAILEQGIALFRSDDPAPEFENSKIRKQATVPD